MAEAQALELRHTRAALCGGISWYHLQAAGLEQLQTLPPQLDLIFELESRTQATHGGQMSPSGMVKRYRNRGVAAKKRDIKPSVRIL